VQIVELSALSSGQNHPKKKNCAEQTSEIIIALTSALALQCAGPRFGYLCGNSHRFEQTPGIGDALPSDVEGSSVVD
jgi:hypothetical protein